MSKKNKQTIESKIAEAVFSGIGHLFRWLWSHIGKREKPDFTAVRLQWDHVDAAMSRTEFELAVSKADTCLDQAFKVLAIRGSNMGERLRTAQPRFSSTLYQSIWEAHKLRNRLAHELGIVVTEHQAKKAVDDFASALAQLGAL
jgi:hypothetical protein